MLCWIKSRKRNVIKLECDLDRGVEAGMLAQACKDRYDKVVNDELLWESWELSTLKRFQEQLNRYENEPS